MRATIVISIMLCIGHLSLYAQDKDSAFRHLASWEEILSLAKEEGKPIFIDYYATWCAPCKKMDQEVYTSALVQAVMKEQFIAVKVQTDSSSKDNAITKDFYAEAARLVRMHHIRAYPTLVVVSAEGKLLHRFSGYLSPAAFVNFLASSLSSDRQYYTLAARLERDSLSAAQLRYLTLLAAQNGDTPIYNKAAYRYIQGYLAHLPAKQLLTKENIAYLQAVTISSASPGLVLWTAHAAQIDSVLQRPGFSRRWAKDFAIKETVNPFLATIDTVRNRPEWNALEAAINKKHGNEFTREALIDAKLAYYNGRKSYDSVIKYFTIKTEAFGYDSSTVGLALFNNFIWDNFFMHGTKKSDLANASRWMHAVVQKTNDPVDIDTYANLLYKMGRRKDAIRWQRRAVSIDAHNASRPSRAPDENLQRTLDKMLAGKATWQ